MLLVYVGKEPPGNLLVFDENKHFVPRGFVQIITVPENRPADPKPATARPMIKAVEVGAEPQIAEPISKMVTHVLLHQ